MNARPIARLVCLFRSVLCTTSKRWQSRFSCGETSREPHSRWPSALTALLQLYSATLWSSKTHGASVTFRQCRPPMHGRAVRTCARCTTRRHYRWGLRLGLDTAPFYFGLTALHRDLRGTDVVSAVRATLRDCAAGAARRRLVLAGAAGTPPSKAGCGARNATHALTTHTHARGCSAK